MIFEDIEEFKLYTKNTISRVLGLDIGAARIGVAYSDQKTIIATPNHVYDRRNIRQDIGYFNRICKEEEITAIVMGLPLELDGSEGENCILVKNFAKKLSQKTNLPIFLQDERMSTAAVTRAMQETKMTRKKPQSKDDKLAAGYILQNCLDFINN